MGGRGGKEGLGWPVLSSLLCLSVFLDGRLQGSSLQSLLPPSLGIDEHPHNIRTRPQLILSSVPSTTLPAFSHPSCDIYNAVDTSRRPSRPKIPDFPWVFNASRPTCRCFRGGRAGDASVARVRRGPLRSLLPALGGLRSLPALLPDLLGGRSGLPEALETGHHRSRVLLHLSQRSLQWMAL